MAFKKKEAEQLLTECGRRCCICGKLHKVQVHHIVPKEKGGSDNIDNGIPLCPNCHDEVHTDYAPGRTTRVYTTAEIKLHRKRAIDQFNHEVKWAPGSTDWKQDKKLITFFAQCLDRPAFRTHFHQELSFFDFDKAMEDSLVAINTGYWRMRDGTLIERGKGKVCVVNPTWRKKLEDIAGIIEGIRRRFHEAFGLNQMPFHNRRYSRDRYEGEFENLMDAFRRDKSLGSWMDDHRQKTIDIMNSILQEIGLQPLRGLREY